MALVSVAVWGRFAVAYADQTERDHEALRAAVRIGKVRALVGT